jgi:hypothetical protein
MLSFKRTFLLLWNTTIRNILNCSFANTAWGLLAGMMIVSPGFKVYFSSSLVISPTPSRQITMASPDDSWELISSPLSMRDEEILDYKGRRFVWLDR